MNWRACNAEQEDPACQGNSTVPDDHYFYYTPIGECGQKPYYQKNNTLAEEYVSSAESAYYATATASIPSSFEPAVSSVSAVGSASSGASSAAGVSSSVVPSVSAVSSAASEEAGGSSAGNGVYAAEASGNSNSGALSSFAFSGLAFSAALASLSPTTSK